MEWPGIQIHEAIASNLIDKLLKFNFITTKGNTEEHFIAFYERNPAGRGLDFTDDPDSKEDFLRYAVELQRLNPVADTRKAPLPPLEDLAEGATVLIGAGLRLGTKPISAFDMTLREAGTQRDWYPDKYYCEQDLSLNTHLGARGAMSTGRVHDPEGAKTIILSYKTAPGAVATIHMHNLKIVCFANNNTCRLRVDKHTTAGGKQDPSMQGKRMVLVYKTNMHSGLSLNPTQCTQRSDQNARQRWLITTLQQPEQYQPTADPPPPLNTDAEMEEQEQEQEHEQLQEQHGIHAPH